MANAPVCNISVNEVINQPPGVKLPSIPQANDLASALQAIQAMTDMLNLLTGQTRNLRAPPGRRGAPGQPGKNNNNKVGRFNEEAGSRVTEEVKMESTDGSVTFTFKQINKLTFRDSITGELIIWQR